jgi:WhiB family transcriptional regulator, redox-sensing transcriptional regulator
VLLTCGPASFVSCKPLSRQGEPTSHQWSDFSRDRPATGEITQTGGRLFTPPDPTLTGKERKGGPAAMTVNANWREDAACRGADPELFFPIGTTGAALRQIQEAKRICLSCPAQTQCLAWALDHGITDGVWGGTTEDQRRAIRRLPMTTALSREDDEGDSKHPAHHEKTDRQPAEQRAAERREHTLLRPDAEGQATWIRRAAGDGADAGRTGATDTWDAERRQG